MCQLLISYSLNIAPEQNSEWVLESMSTHEQFILSEIGIIELNGTYFQFELRKRTELPNSFSLSQNYPNPFNPITQINFELPEDEIVTLKIFNLKGEEVQMLFSGYYNAGIYSVEWDGTNHANQPVSSGVYIYVLESKLFQSVKKMLLMK